MGKGLFLCLFSLLSIHAFAQQAYRLEWGNPFSVRGSESLEELLMLPDSSPAWIVLKYPTFGYHSATLFRFDKNQPKLLAQQRFHHGKTVRNNRQLYKPKYAGIAVTANQLTYFYTAYDPQRDRLTAFGQAIGLDGQSYETPKTLSREKVPSLLRAAEHQFVPSDNQKWFLLFTRHSPEKFKGEIWEMTVFDSDMELYWTNTVQVPYRSEELDALQFDLDSSGTLRLLAKIFPGRQQRKQLRLDNRAPFFALFTFFPQDSLGQFHHTQMLFDSKWVQHLRFFRTENKSLRFAGFYAPKENEQPTGLLTFAMQAHDSLPNRLLLHPFEEGFHEPMRIPGPPLGPDEAAEQLIPKAIIPMPNGASIVLAEQSLLTESCQTDYRTARQYCSFTWFYADIYLFYLMNDGSLKYKIKLPKRQMTTNDQGAFSSFLYFTHNQALHLIWLDHPKNEQLDGGDFRYMTNPKKAHIVHWNLPFRGIPKTRTYPLPQHSGKLVVPMFRDFLVLPNGRVFLNGIYRKKLVPGMLFPSND